MITFVNQEKIKVKKWKAVLVVLVLAINIFYTAPYLKNNLEYFQENPSIAAYQLLIILVVGTPLIFCVYLFLFLQKIYYKFSVDEKFIYLGDKKYPWDKIKNYHLLGQSQDERMGLVSVGGYDPVNMYHGNNIYVLKFYGLTHKTVRIFPPSDRSEEFENILRSHGLQRETIGKMMLVGINKWFILIFVIPMLIFGIGGLIYSLFEYYAYRMIG